MHRVIEEITESNKWRDGEFSKFKTNKFKVDEALWCRMCIPMIYAHWEGFAVSSLKVLIEYLNSLELRPNEVPTNLIVVGLGDSYKSLSGKQSFKQRIGFTDKFKGLFQSTIRFEKKIDVKSNLRADVLEEMCDMFGFCFTNFNDSVADINRLVHIRNSIAHGENSIVPNMQNITKYITSVNDAMDVLLSEIEHFLEKKGYKGSLGQINNT
jgi:hypothetical protein